MSVQTNFRAEDMIGAAKPAVKPAVKPARVAPVAAPVVEVAPVAEVETVDETVEAPAAE
jgi:hypothetical protein